MKSPYKKPSYLSEDEQRNTLATSRGWVLLQPNGKYQVVEAIRDLDVKIAEWEKSVGAVAAEPVVLDESLHLALANSKRTKVEVLQETLGKVKAELAEVKAEIKKVEEKKKPGPKKQEAVEKSEPEAVASETVPAEEAQSSDSSKEDK